MERELKPIGFDTKPVDTQDIESKLKAWLKAQAKTESWILAHALDGLIWGAVTNDWLMTSHDAQADVEPEDRVSPPLRIETLQQLRLFNPDFEVKLWRVGDAWKAIKITDVDDSSAAAFEEDQLLWGTFGKALDGNFTLLEDGVQGMRHVIPPFDGHEQLRGNLGTRSGNYNYIHRACLKVRHYFQEDKNSGVNRIGLSRLVKLGIWEPKNNDKS